MAVSRPIGTLIHPHIEIFTEWPGESTLPNFQLLTVSISVQIATISEISILSTPPYGSATANSVTCAFLLAPRSASLHSFKPQITNIVDFHTVAHDS